MADDAPVVQGGDSATDETKVPSAPVTGPVGLEEARAARAAKLAVARAGLAQMNAGETPAAPPANAERPVPPPIEKPVAPKEPKAETGADEKKPDDKPDLEAKGIDAIEKRAARMRAELAAEKAAAKAELDRERAELAKLRAEAGKAPTIEELQKLAKTPGKTLELLKRLGVETEDDYERYARDTYAVSKSGKADPKNRAHSEAMAEKQGLQAELAELRQMVEETRSQLTQREQAAQIERFQQQYLDEAVKAVPAEPSFIALALQANPEKARATLLALGQRMELEAMEADGATRYDPSYTPSHAEVIARYERDRRADLKDGGLGDDQIAALLAKKPLAPSPGKKPPTTLDVTTRPITPTLNGTGNPTREQKIAAARAGRLRMQNERT